MYRYIKRFLDIVLSVSGIVVLSPVMVILIIAVKCDSKGPAFFTQKRVGAGKKYFNIYKFRSMYTDTPEDMPTHTVVNPDMYITRVGGFLRKTSLDELPQLFNILFGHMSVIGPRPALWNQYDLIEKRDLYGANDVRPGLTGLAQIRGRDEIEIDLKAEIDGNYVKNMCFGLDLKIFFKTISAVLKSEGVVEGVKTEDTDKERI